MAIIGRTAASWAGCAHLVALWTLAVGEPLLRSVRQQLTLSSAPDILVGQTRFSVIAFAVLLLIAPPLIAWVAIRGLHAWRPAWSGWLHMVCVAGLLVALAASVMGDVRGYLSSWMAVPALAIGLAAAWLYWKSAVARTLVTALLVAPVLALAFFLVRAPVSELVFGAPLPEPAAHDGGRTPVTVVVLDEFPLLTIVNERGDIDGRRFPHFAALAREGTWYRRATTVHDYTAKAVPAIVTGRLAAPDSVPYWFDHRRSLFTAFSGERTMRAWETDQDLCPNSRCADAPGQSGGMLRLFQQALRARARELTNGRLGRKPYEDPGGLLSEFTRTLRPRPAGGLEYVHVLLPHDPYVRLASGRRYGSPAESQPGLDAGEVWTRDRAATRLGRRRLDEQTRYLDASIGRLVGRLRALGDFDRGLLVIVADHGAAFVPGESRRTVSRRQVHAIAPVPLFVKYPGQRSGGSSSAQARIVDVLPTVLRAIGKRVPSWVEGKPLQEGGSGTDVVTVHHSVPDLPPVSIPRARLARAEAKDQEEWLRALRPRSLGKRVSGRPLRVALLPESGSQWLAGDLSRPTVPPDARLVAAVDGVIVAELARFGQRFYGLLPERPSGRVQVFARGTP